MSTQDEAQKKAEMEAFVEQVAELASKKVLAELEARKGTSAEAGTQPGSQDLPPTEAMLEEVRRRIEHLCIELGIDVMHEFDVLQDKNARRYMCILACLEALRDHAIGRSGVGLGSMPDMFSLMNAMLGSGTPIGRGHVIIEAR